MLKSAIMLLIICAAALPAFAVLPGQSGRYVGKASVKYTDLGAPKSLSWKTPVVLEIMPDGSATFTGNDIDVQLQITSGPYHGSGVFLDNGRVLNMPLHFIKEGKLKGTFHFAFPGTSEMFEGKFSVRKQN